MLWVSSVVRGLHVWHGSCLTGWKWVIEFLVPCWERRLPWQLPVSACKVCLIVICLQIQFLAFSFSVSFLYRPSYSYNNVAEVRGSSHGAEFRVYCFQRALDNKRSPHWTFIRFNHIFHWPEDHFSCTKRDTSVVQTRVSPNLTKEFFFPPPGWIQSIVLNLLRSVHLSICPSVASACNYTTKRSALTFRNLASHI